MYLQQIEIGKEILSPLAQQGVLGIVIIILLAIISYLFKLIMKQNDEVRTFVKEITKENNEVIAKNTEMFIGVKTLLEQKNWQHR
jgi:uncharacterized protein YpmB